MINKYENKMFLIRFFNWLLDNPFCVCTRGFLHNKAYYFYNSFVLISVLDALIKLYNFEWYIFYLNAPTL